MPIHVALYLVTAFTLSLFLQPSYVIGTETPLREGPMVPPSGGTQDKTTPSPPTSGTNPQQNLPPTTQTTDKNGNTVFTSTDSVAKTSVNTLIPPNVSPEEKDFLLAYHYGYTRTLCCPDSILLQYRLIKFLSDPDYQGPQRAARIGYLMGIQDAIQSHELYRKLIKDTLEGLGVQGVDRLPQLKSLPPTLTQPPAGSAQPSKTPAGPPT